MRVARPVRGRLSEVKLRRSTAPSKVNPRVLSHSAVTLPATDGNVVVNLGDGEKPRGEACPHFGVVMAQTGALL